MIIVLKPQATQAYADELMATLRDAVERAR